MIMYSTIMECPTPTHTEVRLSGLSPTSAPWTLIDDDYPSMRPTCCSPCWTCQSLLMLSMLHCGRQACFHLYLLQSMPAMNWADIADMDWQQADSPCYWALQPQEQMQGLRCRWQTLQMWSGSKQADLIMHPRT